MDLNEFKELDTNKKRSLSDARHEMTRRRREMEDLNIEYRSAVNTGNEEKQKRILEDIVILKNRIASLENLIMKLQLPGNPDYDDADVLSGFARYAREYNEKASALQKIYHDGIETAYQAIRDNAELRKAGGSVQEEYKRFLVDRNSRLDKLETIEFNPQTARFFFSEQIERDGLSWGDLLDMATVSNDLDL